MQADTPTLGHWQRTHGLAGWDDDARHLYATTLCTEALRACLVARLDDIARTAAVLTPQQTILRVATLIAEAT